MRLMTPTEVAQSAEYARNWQVAAIDDLITRCNSSWILQAGQLASLIDNLLANPDQDYVQQRLIEAGLAADHVTAASGKEGRGDGG